MSDDRRRRGRGCSPPPGSVRVATWTRSIPRSSAGRCSERRPSSPSSRSTTISAERLSLGGDDSGALPHWTDPPTGEVPRIAATSAEARPTTSTCGRRSRCLRCCAPVDDTEGRRTPPANSPGTTTARPTTTYRCADLGRVPAVPPDRPAEPPAANLPASRSAPTRRACHDVPTPSAAVEFRSAPRVQARPRRRPTVETCRSRWRGPGARSGVPRAVDVAPAGAVAFVTVRARRRRPRVLLPGDRQGISPRGRRGVAACVAAPLAAYWVGRPRFPW